MPVNPTEIRKALLAAGFELYRTQGDQVHVADRVRDNLIMDSGVSVSTALSVKFVVRSQRSDFPNDAATNLFERARALVQPRWLAVHRTRTVTKPARPLRPSAPLHLYEVSFEKAVTTLEEPMSEVGFALGIEKPARTAAPPSV